MFHIPYSDNEERRPHSTKCNVCTEKDHELNKGKEPKGVVVTEHEFIVLTPVEDEPTTDPMELLKLAKRLVICTQCGTFRLIN